MKLVNWCLSESHLALSPHPDLSQFEVNSKTSFKKKLETRCGEKQIRVAILHELRHCQNTTGSSRLQQTLKIMSVYNNLSTIAVYDILASRTPTSLFGFHYL